MAEGLSKALQSGSDVVVEVSCTPCEEDGSINRAVGYCSTCDQHFCTKCLKYHARFPATKTHTVTEVDSYGQHVEKDTRTMPVAKCIVHPDRKIELYCGRHDMVYCALCVATDHRACTGVIEVTDSITPKMNQSQLHSLLSDIDYLESQLQESEKRKQRNIQQIELKENELLEEIEVECNLLIQHIDKLRESAITQIKEKREQVIVQIKKEVTEAVEMEKNLQTCRSHMSSADTLPNSQMFVQQILGQNTVCKAENLLTSLNSYEGKHIKVDINTGLHDFVLGAAYIAQPKEKNMHENDSKTPPKIKKIIDVHVQVQWDRYICKITGITQLPDGTILICDNRNKKLKRLDDKWTVIDYSTLESEPWGVCCTGDNEVAVKMQINTVKFFSVGGTLSFTRQIKISGGDILGIECIFGQLWVSQGDSINVYSMFGTLLFNIKEVGGVKFTRSPQQVSGSGDIVYVSGSDNQILCLRKEGSLIKVLKDENLGFTRCVCVLRDGTVCTVGYNSDKIIMFGKHGKNLGKLEGSGLGIKNPWTLCYDKKGCNLIVGFDDSNAIKVLSLEL